MEPRDWDPEEMIRDMKNGLYIRGRGALGGEVNPLTGAFTFTRRSKLHSRKRRVKTTSKRCNALRLDTRNT